MEEIWKDIKGYEGYYQVSNFGNIKSLSRFKQNHSKKILMKEKILNPTVGNNGYKMFMLCVNGAIKRVCVHRIVAETFISNPNCFPVVNHIDGNKLNNYVSNLEWTTSSQNNIHAIQNKLRGYRYGENNKHSKLIFQIDKDTDEIINSFYGTGDIKRKLGFNPSCILRCCENKRRCKTAFGYKWKYGGNEI